MERRSDCGSLIKRIHGELEKQANNTLRSQDLTMSQVGALLELSYTPEKQLSLKELERLLGVAQSTAAGIISRLEQKGFVETFGDQNDRRIKLVRMTQLGEACCLLAVKNMDEAEEKLLSGLTETERSIFLTLLQKVCHSLS